MYSSMPGVERENKITGIKGYWLPVGLMKERKKTINCINKNTRSDMYPGF